MINGGRQGRGLDVVHLAVTKEVNIHFLFQCAKRNHLKLVSTNLEPSVIFTPG